MPWRSAAITPTSHQAPSPNPPTTANVRNKVVEMLARTIVRYCTWTRLLRTRAVGPKRGFEVFRIRVHAGAVHRQAR